MAKIGNFIGSIKKPSFVFFIAAILIIMYFLPREGKYKYSYGENRPWQYGLLTAPFKFHIHKSDAQIKQEKDSIMETFLPYYMVDGLIAKKSSFQFTQDAEAKSVPQDYINYVNRELSEIYKAGIISAENYERIQQLTKKQLLLRNENGNNIATTRHIASFYTPRQAYEKIIDDAPAHIDIAHLKAINLNDYLNENILYDEKTSTNIRNDLLQQVSLYEGEIQYGEKIIDRGEIVDARLKNILDSYNQEAEGKVGTKSKPGWLIFGELIMITLLIMT
ncbi:MAG: hydrolase, partial [Prevotella sp.]|nr:hydrolase [Prevotella sp.]